jgi:NhaA family Na+:H+ antiporter
MAVGPKRRGGVSALREFLGSEAVGGMLLIGAALLALLMANGPQAGLYAAILRQPLGPDFGHGPMTVQQWINDGLMAVFFLLVGLEIKREWMDGQLATWRQRRLPMIAAGAGMMAPALVYLLAASGSGLARGWAVPAATDIAFAIGVLALLGDRAPASLKLFLTAVAIVDDMGAVAIIALVYTPALHPGALAAAAAILGSLFLLNRCGVTRLSLFLPLAAGLWLAVLLSGVHATVAGVLAALAIPVLRTPGAPDSATSPLHRLEHKLAGPVAWVVLPVFGFANAGVALGGTGLDGLLAPLPLGVAAGLFLGKQAGVFAAVWLCVRMGIASRLKGAGWRQVYGVSLLCGIGFTMSLFISTLAFDDPAQLDQAKLGILAGSILSAVAGFLVLRFAPRPRES